MSNYVYETHVVDPLLPFIFHTDTVTSDIYCRPNWHSNLELLCCVSGKGDVKLNSQTCHVCPGDVVLINSDVIHATRAQGEFVYHCLIIDSSFCRANGMEAEQLLFNHLIRDDSLTQSVAHLAQLYAGEESLKELHRILEIRHEILGILCVLYGKYQYTQSRKDNFQATQRVKAIVTYIRQNLASPITLEDLAAHVGISKYHLSREFKLTTGMTLFAFLNLCRCAEAKRLMEEGFCVSESAIACGFENMSYFTRTFRKHFGTVPSAFQKQRM